MPLRRCLALTLAALAACSEPSTTESDPHESYLVLRLHVADSAGNALPRMRMFLTIGIPAIDSGPSFPRQFLVADRAGLAVFPLGRYQTSPLDSLSVATIPTECVNLTIDSIRLPPLAFSGLRDTLDVPLILNRPVAPGRLAPGIYCAVSPLPGTPGDIYTAFAIDTVRSDSVFGRFDLVYTGPFGDRKGSFVAAHRSDSLIAFWPIAGCQGATLHAQLVAGDTLGPAVFTTPDCQLLPDTTLTFREDTLFIFP